MNYTKLTILFSVLLFTSSAFAQNSLRITEEHRKLKSAISNFELGHYQQTQDDLKSYRTNIHQKNHEDVYSATANFYDLMASLAQNKVGSKSRVTNFLLETPYASLRQYGYFKLAKFLFEQQEYENAIPFYEKTEINYLSNQEIISRNFELAYCYLNANQVEKVRPLFNSIKDVQGDYHSPGNYYNGVVSYYNGDYTEAIKSFSKLRTTPEYKDIVPFYLAELNYLDGKGEEALEIADNYLKVKGQPYELPMKKLAGHIYYEKGDMANAKNFLDDIQANEGELRDEDLFKMGYTQYNVGEMTKAISYLEKVKSSNSLIATQALYYLGLAYLKNGEKENALNSFQRALNSKDVSDLKEVMTFNSAKLAFDLNKTELAEQALDNFVQNYASSSYYKDAVEMLALLTIKNKNFDKAISSLNKLGSLSPIFQAVYQKANYARGIQMLKDEHADLAIPYFNEALKYPINEDLNGLTEFWKSECHYRLGSYYDALSAVNKFIENPGRGNNPALVKNALLSSIYAQRELNNEEQMKLAYINYTDTNDQVNAAYIKSTLDSMKPNYVPSHIPYVEVNPYVFIYQMPTQNISFPYKPSPLKPIAYSNRSKLPNNKNFIKVGYGNLATPLLQVGYDLSEDTHQDLYLSLSHRSSKGNQTHQNISASQVGLSYKKDIKKYRLNTHAGLSRLKVHTYGMQQPTAVETDKTGIRYLNPEIHVEAKPIIGNQLGIDYSISLSAGLFNRSVQNNSFESNEANFNLHVPLTKSLNDQTKINLGILLDANSNGVEPTVSTGTSSRVNTSFISLQPSIEKMIKGFKLFAGLYPTFGQKIHLLPNVKLSKELLAIASVASLGVESELISNSYKQQATLNPWLSPDINLTQSKRTLYYARLGGSPINNINYNLKGGFGTVTNLPLYISNTADNSYFHTVYDNNATIMSLQGQVEYNINYNTNAGVLVHYEPVLSLDNNKEAWHYVPLQFDVYAKYVYNNSLMLRGDLLARSGTQFFKANGTQGNLKGAFDLNLQANYLLNNRWSMFVEANNILNNKYQRWYNYPNYGFNALIGIVYSFNKSLSTTFANRNIK